jgi:hypothetical protein
VNAGRQAPNMLLGIRDTELYAGSRGDQMKGTKERSKQLKRWGYIILLASFSTQNIVLDYFNSKINKRFQAYEAYSHAYNSNLLYQNLFFNQAQATGVADGDLLRKAAKDNVSGLAVEIVYSGIPKQQKNRKISLLQAQAEKIVDLDSFNNFMSTLNEEESDFRERVKGDYASIVTFKKGTYLAYLALYLLGSCLIIRSVKYE